MSEAHSSRPISSPNTAAYASSRRSAVRDVRKQGVQNRTIQKPRRPVKLGWNLSAQRRKALIASGAVATLVVAIVLPDQVSSEAIAQSNCLEVIQSGAEMSRGEISKLITLPTGSPKQTVRQAIAEPYCTLPLEQNDSKAEFDSEKSDSAEREAYPLAFDPEVWVVLNYESETYTGYDFVFRP